MSFRSFQTSSSRWFLAVIFTAALAIATLTSLHPALGSLGIDSGLPVIAGGHEGGNGNG